MASLLTIQPGKAIWTVFAFALNAFRLPFWLFYYIPRSLRPHRGWSYKQAVRVRIVKAFLYNAAVVKMKTTLSLDPGKEQDRFVTIDPAAASYYVGVTTKDPKIKPAMLGGTWYPQAPGAKTPGFVVLHCHGGAYAIGDGRQEDAGFAASIMLAHTDASHVFCPQYRLSSNAGGRFPAQLQDAISSYVYLVKQGVAPNKIIVSGDSAGGNLVLALVRYIAEHGGKTGLQSPGAAWLWSPWTNPYESIRLGTAAMERNPNYPTDYLEGAFGVWGAAGLQPDAATGLTLEDPYIGFLGNPFATDIPIYIQTGQCEVLLHDNVALAEEMGAIKGNKVALQIEEDSVHDIILAGHIMGFEKEAARAAQRANEFLRKHTAS